LRDVNRRTKIVATIGPASADPEVLVRMVEAGMDVARLNFSHGTHEDHRRRLDLIRAIERDTGRPIGVLLDLQGPKLRIGTFAQGPIELVAGANFRLDLDHEQPGDPYRVPLPHPEIFAALAEGADLLLAVERKQDEQRRRGPSTTPAPEKKRAAKR